MCLFRALKSCGGAERDHRACLDGRCRCGARMLTRRAESSGTPSHDYTCATPPPLLGIVDTSANPFQRANIPMSNVRHDPREPMRHQAHHPFALPVFGRVVVPPRDCRRRGPERFRTCSIARSSARTIVTCLKPSEDQHSSSAIAPDPARRSRRNGATRRRTLDRQWSELCRLGRERSATVLPIVARPPGRSEMDSKMRGAGSGVELDNRGGNC